MNEFERAVLKLRLWPIRRYRDIGGWLSGREALALYRIARGLPPDARVLEIGSWKGKSTVCIARGLRGGVVYALDPFNAATIPEGVHDPVKDRPLLEQFKGNLARFGVADRVQIRPGYSQDYAGTFDALDFLFIDGDHTIGGCRYDYETYAPVVKPGGWLAFHDYRPEHGYGPGFVVDELIRPSADWRFAGQHDSIVVFQRAASMGAA
jgi:MMP 1-O-methyltransferase